YLQKLAQHIQSQFGVLPTVQSIADRWLTLNDIEKLSGIGAATLEGTQRPISVAQYLMLFGAPFVAEENRNESGVVHELEPARPFTDAAQTIYIPRIWAAEPAHRPATLTEVQADVKGDVKTRAAYDMAKADASKLLDQARTTGDLKAAAGKNVITVGPMSIRGQT